MTSRCRRNEFLPANSGETMSDVKAWPHPPVDVSAICYTFKGKYGL